MDAGAVETIAKMQCKIDNYEYFLQNLFIKLTKPNSEVLCISSGRDISNAIWREVEKLQNQVKSYECKASTSTGE
ncbi:hypothetical protein NXV05_11510 [Parabacteroides johnsonii]|jgi:hypothetical protein|nr:hypothetical protein [Parabacteroides johnsonii]DAN20777.1 MAG TPA: hypothetical protein [Caudoviricetes sp.]